MRIARYLGAELAFEIVQWREYCSNNFNGKNKIDYTSNAPFWYTAYIAGTTRKPSLRWQTRATQKDAKIAPIRRVSFHFTELHFPKFQNTNA